MAANLNGTPLTGIGSEAMDLSGEDVLQPTLEDHCVILKSKKSAPTKATRIWKEHVRFVFGKKKCLTDDEIQALKDLQDLHYRCAYGGDSTVSFWVEATPTERGDPCCYLSNVPFVPATEDCIRDEIKNNGVSSKQRKLQIGKRKERDCVKKVAAISPTTPAAPPHLQRFHMQTSRNWKNDVHLICESWIQESHHWAERVVKKHLVDKLQEDISKYSDFCWGENLRTEAVDLYDRRRKGLHVAILLEAVNTLGNGMIEWYEKDYWRRSGLFGGSNHSLLGAPNEDPLLLLDISDHNPISVGDETSYSGSFWIGSEHDQSTVTTSTSTLTYDDSTCVSTSAQANDNSSPAVANDNSDDHPDPYGSTKQYWERQVKLKGRADSPVLPWQKMAFEDDAAV